MTINEGSIPAPAGEPGRRRSGIIYARVYPRACGGTEHEKDCVRVFGGLSPRLRGNPSLVTLIPEGERSIPAPAGEPRNRHDG